MSVTRLPDPVILPPQDDPAVCPRCGHPENTDRPVISWHNEEYRRGGRLNTCRNCRPCEVANGFRDA